jgi:polyhydroxybutyrate depolymerase
MVTTGGRGVIGVVLVLLWLPAAWALVAGVSFDIHNRDNGMIISSGESRSFLLHVPDGLDLDRPVPLIISLHGAAAWPAWQRDVSGWNALADEEGFIVVYPAALRSNGGPRAWNIHRPAHIDRDIQFIADLIDTLEARYNIDAARIYVNGLSAGAGMSFVLSCTLGDRIAAVGMVSSALLLPAHWCRNPQPMPMMAFHGTADRLAPYHGGKSIVGPQPFHDVAAFTAAWARRNGCAPHPTEAMVASTITRRTFTECTADASVVLHTIHGGGHTWPGGMPDAEWFLGPTSQAIDATSELWTFFRGMESAIRSHNHALERPGER